MSTATPSRPGDLDTGEMLAVEIGFQRAMDTYRHQRSHIKRLEEALLRIAVKYHHVAHGSMPVGMRNCPYMECRQVKELIQV